MAVNIKTLLNKSKLSGREVGTLLLYSSVSSYENTLKTRDFDNPPKQVFTEAEMKRMIKNLESPWDIKQYNKFVSINNYVMKEMGFAAAYLQQAQTGHYRLTAFLEEVLRAEQHIEDLQRTPCIMTEKEYAYYRDKALEEQRAYEDCWFDVYARIANHYISLYEDKPEAENPLAAVLADYESRTFKDKGILSRYAEKYGHYCGHYETTDGHSQADMTAEEWEQFVNEWIAAFRNKRNALGYRPDYYDNLEAGVHDFSSDIYSVQRGMRGSNAESPIFEYFHWVQSDGIKELRGKGNLWNIIGLYEIFEYVDTLKMAKKEYTDFQKHFPELDAAIMAVYRELFPLEAERPIEEFKKTVTTWGDMIDRGILGREIEAEPNDSQIAEYILDQQKRYRANMSGIAILKENRVNMFNVDEQGFYIEPDTLENIMTYSIDAFMDSDLSIQQIEFAREYQLEEGLREAYAYNEIIKLTSKYSGVELDVFSQSRDIEKLELQIEAYNQLILQVRRRIQHNTGMFGIDKARERYDAFCQIFPIIDVENLKPKQSNIDSTWDYINENETAFSIDTPKITSLMKRKGEADDEEIDEYADDAE